MQMTHPNITTGKDTSWLQVEVCREFLRSKCARDEGECRYAHPGNNIQIDNGFVTACYDSIKSAPFVSIVPALYPEYVTSAPLEPILINNAIGNSMPKKPAKVDRMEVCRQYRRGTCSRGEDECRYAHPPTNVVIDKYDNTVTLCMDHIKGKCQRDVCRYFHPPPHLLTRVKQQQAQPVQQPLPQPQQQQQSTLEQQPPQQQQITDQNFVNESFHPKRRVNVNNFNGAVSPNTLAWQQQQVFTPFFTPMAQLPGMPIPHTHMPTVPATVGTANFITPSGVPPTFVPIQRMPDGEI
ncbi:Muscleblind-like protein 3 [Trichoplax sp. H2]|nr:Muscleblind-like protein 3 [Trichoplax sp. H2]|eukprot:RDD39259.1 Muscleblind-like protein 3 [Trichoplax sp. H2]